MAEVAIVACPDEKWGEVPKAFVGLKPGALVSAEELIAWCRTSGYNGAGLHFAGIRGQ